MPLAVISAIAGVFAGVLGCYVWREAYLRRQLRQVLAVMESSQSSEDVSLPIVSKLRRQAAILQQQQQQLEQQRLTYQNALTRAPIGYLQLDDENQILLCNPMAQHLLNIQNWESGQTRLLLELVRSYELDRAIEQTRVTQTPNQLVWQFYSGYSKTVGTESMWLEVNTVPLFGGVIGVFIENQQARIDAATARERWLADLAHEIRTPLTSIRLVAETLETRVTPNLTRWVQRMLQETTRLIDLVQHFLELSQLESAPAQSLQLTVVKLTDPIEDAWHSLEPIAGQRQIELICTVPDRLVLKIDRARFTQVFINLFDNSIKYCRDRGHIWIDVRQINLTGTSPHVEINFYDDGNGFTENDLPYVFDRLYRGDISRQRQLPSGDNLDRQTTGSGLGLSIVRQIVLAHGGTVTAHNHPNTGGAWIQLILPQPESI